MADQLKERKKDLLVKMPRYYRFLNKVIDILLSDKNELVIISDTLGKQLGVNIYKISKNNEADKLLYSRVLDPSVTKEIRIFLQGGDDSVFIKNNSAPCKNQNCRRCNLCKKI